MALFGRSKHTIGLDIGSALVKVAVIDHSAEEPKLLRLASRELSADAIVEGEIMDPGVVVEAIQSVIQGVGTKTRSIVTAVGGRDIIVKKIKLDRMPASDARAVISWEAEQYVPFDMQNVQLDFQILDPEAEGLQMNALLVAAKKELVEQRTMLLGDAGISPSTIDVDAFALFNAFEYNYPSAAKGFAALVNVGHEVTTIIVQEEGVPIVTRDVPFGSKHLREDLRRLHGMSAEEADRVLRGDLSGGAEIDSVLADRASELALAIERATAFLNADLGAAAGIAAVYLSGGAARVPRLQEAIAERLRVKVEVVNPLQRLEIAPEATADLPGEDTAALWMLPVGLALRAPA